VDLFCKQFKCRAYGAVFPCTYLLLWDEIVVLGDCLELCCYYPFDNFPYRAKECNWPPGSRLSVRGLPWLLEDNRPYFLESLWVMSSILAVSRHLC
jgi:hypothetical protein